METRNKHTDPDIRLALKRKYAGLTDMPEGFKAKVLRETAASNKRQKHRFTAYLLHAAVAASIVIAVIHFGHKEEEKEKPTVQPVSIEHGGAMQRVARQTPEASSDIPEKGRTEPTSHPPKKHPSRTVTKCEVENLPSTSDIVYEENIETVLMARFEAGATESRQIREELDITN